MATPLPSQQFHSGFSIAGAEGKPRDIPWGTVNGAHPDWISPLGFFINIFSSFRVNQYFSLDFRRWCGVLTNFVDLVEDVEEMRRCAQVYFAASLDVAMVVASSISPCGHN